MTPTTRNWTPDYGPQHPGSGESARPRRLTHWCGIDLAAAIHVGADVVQAHDGRRAVLVPIAQEASPGDRVQLDAGKLLVLSALLGVVGEPKVSHVLWLTQSPGWRP